jgi:hypothetical protein
MAIRQHGHQAGLRGNIQPRKQQHAQDETTRGACL